MGAAPNGNKNWILDLPSEYHDNKSLARFQDVPALAKSYLDLEGFMSTSTRLPKADAPKEEWDKFYSGWGRPGKAEEYKMPTGLPEGFAPPEPMQKSLFEAAHSIGLNQKQFESLVAWAALEGKNTLDAQNAELIKAQDELKKKWGFRYDNNRDLAVRTISTLVGMKKDHPFIKWLESTGNDQNPIVLEFFHELSAKFVEDGLVSETQQKQTANQADAQKRINEIMSDPKSPYYIEGHPQQPELVAEVLKLYEVLNPS